MEVVREACKPEQAKERELIVYYTRNPPMPDRLDHTLNSPERVA